MQGKIWEMIPGVESRVARIRIYILNYISEFTFGYATTCSYVAKASLELALLAARPCLLVPNGGPLDSRGRPGKEGEPERIFRRLSAS